MSDHIKAVYLFVAFVGGWECDRQDSIFVAYNKYYRLEEEIIKRYSVR